MSAAYWCEYAWLPAGPVAGVVVRCADGRIVEVSLAETAPAGARVLRGLVLPGFANVHSHAFHRALRGRTHGGGGTFWTWRDAMYTLANRLDPDSYLRLATAAYAEMAVAGVSVVGEFHYLHHPPGGGRYAEPNAMGEALAEAAAVAGIRLTLLDTCYLAGGIGTPLGPEQARFSDGDAHAWADRARPGVDRGGVRVGAAIHSVRAVPRGALATVVEAARGHSLHVHVSEQPAENEACLAAYGRTPVELLDEAGALGPRTTAVHATHLSTQDIGLLGRSRTAVCLCPTTEADLADGLGPAGDLRAAGSPLSLGSDQHAVVDPLVEARSLELGERLRTGRRGHFTPGELVDAATAAGNDALGWPGGGRLEPGAPADLVALGTRSVRTAGCRLDQIVLAATAADVGTVVAGGRVIAVDGRHETLGDVGALLDEAIGDLW
ncbi:formimidoylglutamate deiminase [Actinophytocola xinjiangensis]|uniref:Formimidoylglutamate deiminase n=1 Tax=Actinophytocola xinjiangensis TaxID=485602 RepID=A0A7Z0WHB5_9PSEU|nr:formimidoylglutamate deiminase [Actinophytocola xinjiangensis]OLF06522.1 formimidoylglutamate deiminase [Actinophytocola xinjiangensis]